MAECIEREVAVKNVMAAKWIEGYDGAMAMEIVAAGSCRRCCAGGTCAVGAVL